MAPRLQLLRCWYASHTLQASPATCVSTLLVSHAFRSVFRYGCFASHGLSFLINVLYAPAQHLLFQPLSHSSWSLTAIFIGHNLTWALLPLMMTANVRARIYRWMMNRGLTEEQRSVMIVAQLMGDDVDIDAVMSHASSRFRGLPFEKLEPRHFEKDLPYPNELYDKSVPTALGKCDAFVSQSWHPPVQSTPHYRDGQPSSPRRMDAHRSFGWTALASTNRLSAIRPRSSRTCRACPFASADARACDARRSYVPAPPMVHG